MPVSFRGTIAWWPSTDFRSATAVEPAARHIALRDLGRYIPDVKGVALVTAAVSGAAARNPVSQTQDLEICLLFRKEVDLPELVEVAAIAVDGDKILSGRDIAVGGAT